MSTLATAVAAAAASEKPLVEAPAEAVVVNSIIYSKPSFCRISVDLSDGPVVKTLPTKKLANTTGQNMKCFSEAIMNNTDCNIDAASYFANMAINSSDGVGEDAKLYRICTTINGSINHQISDLCDNLLAVAGYFGATNNRHDDDSFIEFAYTDDSEDEDDDDKNEVDENEDDFVDSDDEDEDNDVVYFSYDCPVEPAPKLNCDSKKKVRFNLLPTVHVMHTWRYAYHAARKGEWEMYARDRERFKMRIQRTASTLNPILQVNHRQKIYEERFAHISNEIDEQNKDSAEIIKSTVTSTNTESKNPHQKKKRRKRRFCKMGNKHYF